MEKAQRLRSLFSRVSLNDYLAPASAGTGVDGAARELNAALGVSVMGPSGGVAIPFNMLMERTYTASRNLRHAEHTRTRRTMMDRKHKGQSLQRLFGPGRSRLFRGSD